MKPKLVITTDTFLPRLDGIGRFLSGLLPYLDSFDVTIIAPEFHGEYVAPPGMKIVRVPLRKLSVGDFTFARSPKKEVMDAVRTADIVFNQTIGPIGMAAINAANRFNKPIINYTHSIEWELAAQSVIHAKSIVRFFIKRLAVRYYNKCSLLIVPSREAEYLLSNSGIRTKKRVVPLGTDTTAFVPPLSKGRAKQQVGIPQQQFVIGFVGRLGREKNLSTLYRAFRRVLKTHPETALLIVGKGLEFEWLSSKNVIHIPGAQSVVSYFQAMDIYVLPSLTETTSLSTMEAMACGVPVVVTPVGLVREYVVNGKNGFIFPRHDVAALSEKLNYLITHSQERIQMGTEARQTILNNHHWDKTAKQIVGVLRQVYFSQRK